MASHLSGTPGGITSHDIFGRVFARLDPDVFCQCFLDWMRTLYTATGGKAVAIDGKTLRRSYDKENDNAALHMVHAWAVDNHLLPGQVATDEKSNEITAIPELLKVLDLNDCLVTIDAMGCQKKIARAITKKGGEYVLGLKGNHSTLKAGVEDFFDCARRGTRSRTWTCSTIRQKGICRGIFDKLFDLLELSEKICIIQMKRWTVGKYLPERHIMRKAVITGITGQDGSYLAELLLSKGYEVHGLIRRSSSFNTRRIDHLYCDPHSKDVKLFLHYGDIAAHSTLMDMVYNIRPDEIYHLAAQSHVRVSFDMPEYTGDITGLGTVRILEAIRKSGVNTKFYQASSSEMYGSSPAPQNEETPFAPQSPYAAAKLYAYWLTKNYREGYGLFAVNGILFNHESPRRGETFVTRKITRAIANIKAGRQDKLYLGNLDAKRDWGYAPEYVEAMWMMLQQENPQDYAIGTGETHTVREFLAEAFGYAGMDWERYVTMDERYLRPTEVNHLQCDPSKAKERLKWSPKIRFRDLVKIMMDADLELVGEQAPGAGRALVEKEFSQWHFWKDQTRTMENYSNG